MKKLIALAVAAAAYYIPKKTANVQEILMIAVTAGAVFAILDQFTPAVSAGARHGAGFGIGYNITNGLEGFDDNMDMEEDEEMESEDLDTDSDEEEYGAGPMNSPDEPGDMTDDDLDEPFSSIM